MEPPDATPPTAGPEDTLDSGRCSEQDGFAQADESTARVREEFTTSPAVEWQAPGPARLTALLPQYRVLTLIGCGGMGAVYLAQQINLDRLVAIKVLPPVGADVYDFRDRFHREAKAMAHLSHPHIVAVYDFGQTTEDHLYFVMEYVDGTDLEHLIRNGPVPPSQALRLASQICDALHYSHGHGVVHRDIKPSNIMITAEGEVKIADFGLARQFDDTASRVTQVELRLGTPDYAAPEQFGGAEIDHRADLYAFGVMLYEMLTAQVPRGTWHPPSALVQGLDPRWDPLVTRAMEPEPSHRFQQATEIRRALDAIATQPLARAMPRGPARGAAALPTRPDLVSARGKVASKNSPVKVVGILAAAAVVGGALWFRPGGPPKQTPPSEPADKVAATFPPPLSELLPTGPPGSATTPSEAPPAPSPPENLPTTPDPPSPAAPTAGLTEMSFGGHRYRFVAGRFSWDEAKAQAEALGGHLVTITTPDEDAFIRQSFAPQLTAANTSFWLGGFSNAPTGGWQWVTSEPFEFTAWAPAEPDGLGPNQAARLPLYLDFLRADAGGNPSWGWHDTPQRPPRWQRQTRGFVVEWDTADPRSPTGTTPPALASAQTPSPASTPPTGGLSPATTARLHQLEQGYQAASERDALAPFRDALKALDEKYPPALERAMALATRSNRLEEAVALKNELQRVTKREPLPVADLDTLPPSLLDLRKTYRRELGRIEAARDAKLVALSDKYAAVLAALQTEVTTAGQLDDAVGVKELREQVLARRPAASSTAGPADAPAAKPAPSSAPPGGTPVPVPPDLLASPGRPEHTRELAEWCLRRPTGRVVIREGNERRAFTSRGPLGAGSLPKDALDLIILDLGEGPCNDFKPEWLIGETNLIELHLYQAGLPDPAVLRGMKNLEVLWSHANADHLTAEGILRFPPLPALQRLHFHSRCGNQGLRVLCERAPALRALGLGSMELTDGGLAPLLGLKNLTELHFVSVKVPPAERDTLARLPKLTSLILDNERDLLATAASLKQLQDLRFVGSDLLDADLAPLTGLKELRRLELQRNKLTDAALPALGAFPKLTTLVLNANRLQGTSLASLAPLRSLESLSLCGQQLTGASVATLPGLPNLASLEIFGNPGLTDEASPGLVKCRNLSRLNLAGSALGDAGLQALCNGLKNLRELNLSRTRLTDAGTAALRRLDRLDMLWLTETTVGDQTLDKLRTLTALTQLDLTGTRCTPGAIARLRKDLPACHIIADQPK